MRNFRKIVLGSTLIFGILLSFLILPDLLDNEKLGLKKMSREQRKAGRTEYLFNKLKDPVTGKIPINLKAKEINYSQNLKGADFIEGRIETDHYNWAEVGPYDVGGRLRSLEFDSRNGSIVFAGAVNGGIWKSADKGATWSQRLDPGSNLTISGIAQDKVNPDVWYASTGEREGGSTNSKGEDGNVYTGNGIYKSTDNGDTWELLTYTEGAVSWEYSLSLSNDNSIANKTSDPFRIALKILTKDIAGVNYIFLCTQGKGIWVSTDNASNFSQIADLNLGGENLEFYPEQSDLVIDGNGEYTIWYSRDSGLSGSFYHSVDGSNWTDVTPNGYNPNNYINGRTVMTNVPSNDALVYAFSWVGDSPGENYLYKFDFQSSTVSNLTSKFPEYDRNDYGDPFTAVDTQNGYNMTVAVHPTDENLVLVGGTILIRSLDGFATDLTVDPKKSWIGGYTNPYLRDEDGVDWGRDDGDASHHADNHVLTFDPDNPDLLWSGHDGGISISTDITAERVTWVSKNNGFNVTQYYDISISPNFNNFQIVGGCQDNGTPLLNVSGITFGSELANIDGDLSSGDGSYSFLGNENLYVSSQSGNISMYSVTNSEFTSDLSLEDDGYSAWFIHPFAIDPLNDDVLLTFDSETGTILRYSNDLSTKEEFSLSENFILSSLKFSYFEDSHKAYFGGIRASDGEAVIFSWPNANNSDISAAVEHVVTGATPSSWLSDIAINPWDSDEILLTYSNYNIPGIFHSEDGGETFTIVEGNLGTNDEQTDFTGPAILSAEILVDELGEASYFVGTSIGLFKTSTLDVASTMWTSETTSLDGIPIHGLDSRVSDNTIAVGTHGRGAFMAKYDGQPNLIPYDDDYTPTNITGSTDLKAGDKLKFDIAFLNAGKKVITGPFDIVILGGSQEQGRMTVSESFDPGSINLITFESTTGMKAGTSDWKIVLDDGNSITEASETDNELALGAVTVGTAPLAIDFSANPTSIEISELVNDGKIKFTPTVTGGDGQYTYDWTFSDGSPATSNEESPEVTYSAEGNFDVTLKVTDGLGETLTEIKTGYISVILVSGIDDDISDLVSIYPNPTVNELVINSSLLQNARLYLWNTSGQIMNVPVSKKSNEETIMNVNSLNSGVYFLEIITSDKKLKSRILINK